MKFFTTAKLGPSRSKTPEGFLVCEAVPVARTGEMLYAPEELGLEPAPDGIVHLHRVADDLFRPETIASFEGKPVLGEHNEVLPANWKSLAWGHMQNVRRGTGADSEMLLADLIVMDAAGIAAVEGGREEVSLFYDFDFVPTGTGRGRQTNILGNHVAVVEAGRCGPTCRIGDHLPKPKVSTMAKLPWWGRAMAHAIKAGDEDTAAEIAEASKEKAEGADEDDPVDARFKKLEEGHAAILAAIEELKGAKAGDEDEKDKEKTGDEEDEDIEKMKSGDSGRALLRAEWQDVMSRAEILAPGAPNRLVAFDSAGLKTVRQVRDAMCRCRKSAMDHAMATDTGLAIMQPLLQGRTLDSIPCDQQATLFNAASEMARFSNNARISAGDADLSGPVVFNPQAAFRR